MIASTMGHTNIVEKLVETELSYTNQYKETALMNAFEASRFDCAKLLLEEAGKKDYRDHTALMKAVMKGNQKVVDLLIDIEGKIQDQNGQTALMYAARKDRVNIIKCLTKEIGMCDNSGWTALMHAALNGSVGAVRQLSSEVGAKSTDYCMMHPPGTTALMIAAAAGKTRIVEKLAAHESGIFDSRGNCALLLALQHGHRDCSLLLLSEARAFDADGRLCFTRLQESYQMSLDTGEPFVAC